MTMTPPVVNPVTLDPSVVTFRAPADIQPFSYRDTDTYLTVLNNMRRWLYVTLVPYLNANFEDLQGGWEDNVQALDDTINAALAQQATNINAALTAQQQQVTASLQQTLNDITSGESAALNDSVVSNALQVANSQALAFLETVFITPAQVHQITDPIAARLFQAPAPSGGDDTAVLQALLTVAQNTNGTLVLQPGTYVANLSTAQSFLQPRIIGQGKDQTTIRGAVSTAPVLRFKGGAGQLSGGFLADFTIKAATAGGGVGLQLADTGGFRWARIRFAGALAEGIQFLSEASGAFCEFNHGEAEIQSSVVLPVHYARSAGNESFHGTGLDDGSVITQSTTASATVPMVQIDGGCFPYASPMGVSFFPKVSGSSIISNRNTGRVAAFKGNMDIEVQSGATGVRIGDNGSSPATGTVVLEGNVNALISGSGLVFGKAMLADKVYYNGGTTVVQRKPWQENVNLGTGTTPLVDTSVSHIGAGLLHVEIVAANYDYEYTLAISQDTYSSTSGNVTILATHKSLNTAGYGAPTFGWGTYGPTITNAQYPASGVVAYIDVIPFNHNRLSDRMQQL